MNLGPTVPPPTSKLLCKILTTATKVSVDTAIASNFCLSSMYMSRKFCNFSSIVSTWRSTLTILEARLSLLSYVSLAYK